MTRFRAAVRMICSARVLFVSAVGVFGLSVATILVAAAATLALLDPPNAFENASDVVAVRLASAETGETTSPAFRTTMALQNSEILKEAALIIRRTVHFRDASGPERTAGLSVWGGFCRVLGITPILGRCFSDADYSTGESAVILTERLWDRSFSRKKNIVGETVYVDRVPHVVVGVVPELLGLEGNPTLILPLSVSPSDRDDHGVSPYTTYGLLAAPLRVAQLQADALSDNLATAFPDTNSGYRIRLTPFTDLLVPPRVRRLSLLLVATAGILLGVTSLGIGALVMGVIIQRRAELAIRITCGASTWDLLGEVGIQVSTIGLFGSTTGLVLATWLLPVVIALAPPDLQLQRAALDARALLLGGGGVVVAVFVMSVSPGFGVFVVRRSMGLARGTPVIGKKHASIQALLLSVEVAGAVVLLIGAALLWQSLTNARHVDVGARTQGILTALLSPVRDYPTDARRSEFYRQMLGELRAAAGEGAVALASWAPLSRLGNPPAQLTFGSGGGRPRAVLWRAVSPDFFRVLAVNVVSGREFLESDAFGGTCAVILNESLARLGATADRSATEAVTISVGRDQMNCDVVGIVRDVRQRLWSEPEPEMFLSVYQFPPREATILSKFDDLSRESSMLRGTVKSVDPNQPVSDIRALNERIGAEMGTLRFQALLLGAAAIVAACVVLVGLAGVSLWSLQRRRKELAIRLALGATERALTGMIVASTARAASWGVLAGVLTALSVTRVLERSLFGVSPLDAVTYLEVVTGTLLAVGAVTVWSVRQSCPAWPAEAMSTENN